MSEASTIQEMRDAIAKRRETDKFITDFMDGVERLQGMWPETSNPFDFTQMVEDFKQAMEEPLAEQTEKVADLAAQAGLKGHSKAA